MKKRYIFLILAITLNVSCSSDDGINKEEEAYFLEAIIGSWSYETIKVDDQTYIYPHTENCRRDMFQFYNEEGKIFEFEESIVMNCDICAPCATSNTGLQWELRGNIVKLYFGEQFVTQLTLLEVTDTYMTYTREIDVDEDGDNELVEIYAIYHDPFGDFD